MREFRRTGLRLPSWAWMTADSKLTLWNVAFQRTFRAFPAFDLHLAANGSALEYSAANTPESSARWQVFRLGLAGTDSGAASVNNAGGVANTDTGNVAGVQGISGDGTTVFFSSGATNLSPAATDGQLHGFVRTQGSLEHFAVVGDSYSSGEGVPPFIPPSGADHCDRSYHAYAEDIAALSPEMALTGFGACSGATSHQIITGMNAENSQLQFVILTAGGDDIGFGKFVTACLLNLCAKGSKAYERAENAIRHSLPSNMAMLFDHLTAVLSRGTRVLVLGYPDVLPPTGAPYICSTLKARDQTAAQKVEGDLNAAIVAAVKTADASKANVSFEYVDPFIQFDGHELCSPHPYFRGLSRTTRYSYHPNAAGQQAYARAVKAYLVKHPAVA